MSWLMILVSASGLLLVCDSQSYTSCSYDRMKQCKNSIDRSIQKRVNDMSRQDMISHCNVVREDFNCLLRQTRCLSSENDRRRNGDVLRNGLVYIRDGCDSLGGGWKESTCYKGDGMSTCESSYPVSSGQFSSSNTENCRKYTQFYDCVMHTIKNRCRADDDRLIGQYLVEKVQELAWNCQDLTTSYQSTDRDRDRDRDYSRETDNGRGYDRSDRYGSRSDYDRDRSRDDYRSRSDSGHSSDRRSGYDDRYGSDRNYGSSSYDSGDMTCCRNERCDRYRMQQCRDSLTRTIDERNPGYQDAQKCKKTRNDFNCLLFQTACLPRDERDRVSDVFQRGRDYLSRTCDTYGRWKENNCFTSDEMQRCESYLSNTRSGANYEACRSFTRFKECMNDELNRRCTRDDELFQGAYLVEKAQEMAWQCGNENSNSNSRFSGGGYDRDRYSSGDRRSDYNNPSPFGFSEEDKIHLDDDDENCVSRMQNYVDRCKRELDEKRRQLIIENDYDLKQKGTCCSARRYRTCLSEASRTVCQRERSRVIDNLMGRYRYELDSDKCRRIYDSDCSAANALISSNMLLSCFLAILPIFLSISLSL